MLRCWLFHMVFCPVFIPRGCTQLTPHSAHEVACMYEYPAKRILGWLAPQGTDALVSRWARCLPVFVVRSFHETSHELSSRLHLAPFRIFTATPHRTHHGSPTTGSGFWHRAHRLVSRRPRSALRRTLVLTPSPRAPRSQGFVMPPTGAVAVRSSALSTESPVMLFGAKKPAPKKVAKRPVKKARSLVKEVAGHSSLRHTPREPRRSMPPPSLDGCPGLGRSLVHTPSAQLDGLLAFSAGRQEGRQEGREEAREEGGEEG